VKVEHASPVEREAILFPKLTSEETVALNEVSQKRMISREHRERLLKTGDIREIIGPSLRSILSMTGLGLRRLERGKSP
jgi:hypothetical protein